MVAAEVRPWLGVGKVEARPCYHRLEVAKVEARPYEACSRQLGLEVAGVCEACQTASQAGATEVDADSRGALTYSDTEGAVSSEEDPTTRKVSIKSDCSNM